MKHIISYIAVLLALTLGHSTVLASPGHCEPNQGTWGTPDTCTPSREDPCIHWKSDEALGSKPYGLCIAYCEAQDCDTHNDNKKSCRQLEKNLYKLTGTTDFACGGEDGGEDED